MKKLKLLILIVLIFMLISTLISYAERREDSLYPIYARSNDASRGYGIVTDEGVVFSAFEMGKTIVITRDGLQTLLDEVTIPFVYSAGKYLYWPEPNSDLLIGDSRFLPDWYQKKQSIDLPIAYLEDMVKDVRTISDGEHYFTSSIDAYSGEPQWTYKYGTIQPMDGTWIIASDGTSAKKIDDVSSISGYYLNKIYYDTFEGKSKSYDLKSEISKPDVQFRWVVDGKIFGTELDTKVGGKIGFLTKDTIIYYKEGTWRFEKNFVE